MIDRLTDIETREQAATKGPWWNDSHEIYQGAWEISGLSEWVGETCDPADDAKSKANAAFIAHARADVPWLIDQLRQARDLAAEMQYLSRCLDAVLDVCDKAEKQATRWESPLPVPEWVTGVREAASGERPNAPDDRRRRLYRDGEGNAWLSIATDTDGTLLIAPSAGAMPTEAEPENAVRERTGGLREIGRCW